MNAEQTKTRDNNANDEGAEGEADEVTIHSSHDSMSDGKNVECSINTRPKVLFMICVFSSDLLMKNFIYIYM
jgi:hypothetical protein